MIDKTQLLLIVENTIRDTVGEKIHTDVELAQIIDNLRPNLTTGMFSEISDEEYNQIAEKIKKDCCVHIEDFSILEKPHTAWFKDAFAQSEQIYWRRYNSYLMRTKKMQVPVIRTLDEFTTKIMEHCGDPHLIQNFAYRGMVIGEVQSGKTGTFIGIINKAADVGYQIFIVLTGTSNNLRAQTQSRVDEGFIGLDSSASNNPPIGVSLYGRDGRATTFTTFYEDYNSKKSIDLRVYKGPIVFVVKKNSNVLEHLYTGLHSDINIQGISQHNYSLMVIDDEADNASVNTKDDSITKINFHIRRILKLFTKSTYIGFTATPFANIFIDFEATDTEVGDDLFPEDFIAVMAKPSNYIGAEDIFNPKGKYHSMVRYNDDMYEILDKVHRNGTELSGLPDSLAKAIRCFILSCAIRELRGDRDKPMGMLINLSRFVYTHGSIADIVGNEFYKLKVEILNQYMRGSKALNNPIIKSLYNTWIEEYGPSSSYEFSWDEVQKTLGPAISPIEYIVVNSENKAEKALNYKQNPKMRVIVIGGDALSRGLTIEGLAITYFYRNSHNYDTLMQMGRWFGYRDGYADLCRVWIDKENEGWFEYISQAVNDLKDQLAEMEARNRLPREFGLRVQQNIKTLKITAYNKMLHTGKTRVEYRLSNRVLETVHIMVDKELLEKNYAAIESLIIQMRNNNCKETDRTARGNRLWEGVPSQMISDFIGAYQVNDLDIYSDGLIETINSNPDLKWDVCIRAGTSSNIHYGIKDAVRNNYSCKEKRKQIRMNRGRLISPKDLCDGSDISKEKEAEIDRIYGLTHKNQDGEPKAPPVEVYMENRTHPILCIFYLDLLNDDSTKEDLVIIRERLRSIPHPPTGIAIGFPSLDKDGKGSDIYYVTNSVYEKYRLKQKETEGDGEFD